MCRRTTPFAHIRARKDWGVRAKVIRPQKLSNDVPFKNSGSSEKSLAPHSAIQREITKKDGSRSAPTVHRSLYGEDFGNALTF
jgi:hypothetical protein